MHGGYHRELNSYENTHVKPDIENEDKVKLAISGKYLIWV